MERAPSQALMGSAEVDESEFPLVIVRFRGVATDAEFADYLARLDGIYKRNRRFALVLDATKSGATPAKHRKMQAEWIHERIDRIRMFNVGTAFVIPSTIMRGVLTAILWMQPLPNPHHVCESMPEAIRWARERLAAAGNKGALEG